MIETVEIDEPLGLDDYAEVAHLRQAVESLRERAAELSPRLEGRKVWMVNSTAQGGGVAEMLPKLVLLLNQLGVSTEWLVMGTNQTEFFGLTKRLHNLIHGQGDPGLDDDDHALYAAVSSENASELKRRVGSNDILVIHDPQPLGMGAMVKQELEVPFFFRCHIGLDGECAETRAAWSFLRPYAEHCDRGIFSAQEYVPDFLADRCDLIRPAIDPLSFKNRELTPHRISGVLCNSGLALSRHPVVPRAFVESATRLAGDGTFAPIDEATDIGMLYRPIVLQISRWDALKGFKPLLEGFVRLKQGLASPRPGLTERHARRLKQARLILAGPDPAAVADDPEAQDVLEELTAIYVGLSPQLQKDIAVISLPMTSRKDNALMVNALQRCASVVVQNSLREGFGLTVTEALWKRCAVLGSRACGIRQQIQDGVEGRLLNDCEDSAEIAETLDRMLDDLPGRARQGRAGQLRVHDDFLVFTQARDWIETLAKHAGR